MMSYIPTAAAPGLRYVIDNKLNRGIAIDRATLVLTGASMEIANPLACILVILVQSLPDSIQEW